LVHAILAAALLIAAPSAARALDVVLYNQSQTAVRLGGPTGPLAEAGKSARYSTPTDASDIIIYIPADRCMYHYEFSASSRGFPWGQSPTASFKLQLGGVTDLALLPQDASDAMRPRPRQPGGFPLFPPKVQCAPE